MHRYLLHFYTLKTNYQKYKKIYKHIKKNKMSRNKSKERKEELYSENYKNTDAKKLKRT